MPIETLPPHAQAIWEEVYEGALARKGATRVDATDSEKSSAAKQAWSVVKKSYCKKNGRWVRRKPKKSHYAARGRVYKF